MKNRNLSLPGKYFWTVFPSGNTIPFNSSSGTSFCQASGVVQGDKKTPYPFSYTVRDSRLFRGKVSYYYNGTLQTISDGSFGDSSSAPQEPPWDRNSVYNSCLSKLNSKVRGNLDLTISLAQAPQTIRMIKDVTKFLNQVNKGGLVVAANGWLQWQYGWKQLMADIFGAADLATKNALNQIERVNVRSSLPIQVNDVISTSCHSQVVQAMRAGGGKQSCTICCTFDVPSWDPYAWGSLSPATLLWELIPYSFVVDWFYNVGGYLRDLETSLLYSTRFRTGYVSELYAYDGTETVQGGFTVTSGPNRYVFSSARSSIRTRRFERRVLSSWPMPRQPSFKSSLGSQRLITAAALLAQRLPGASMPR